MGSRFKDKVAIVTGGCQGIGKGCVEELVEQGGKVVVFDIKDELGKQLETAGECDDDSKANVHYVHCDVTKEDDIKLGIQQTVDMFGGLNLLVNNAGWHPPVTAVDEFSSDDFRSLLDLNLVSYFMACKYALPHLRQSKGSIVNISSLVGQIGQPSAVTYCATKAGIVGMTKALAIDEARHGVRVNAVSPSAIHTPLLEQSLLEQWADTSQVTNPWEKVERSNHLHRVGTPREVGNACLYLAVDATFTTGIDLNVTGGAELGYGAK